MSILFPASRTNHVDSLSKLPLSLPLFSLLALWRQSLHNRVFEQPKQNKTSRQDHSTYVATLGGSLQKHEEKSCLSVSVRKRLAELGGKDGEHIERKGKRTGVAEGTEPKCIFEREPFQLLSGLIDSVVC